MNLNKEIALITTSITCLALYLSFFDDDALFDEKEKTDVNENRDQKNTVLKPDAYNSYVSPKSILKRPLRIKKKDSRTFYKRLLQDFETTQVTLTNLSDVYREVRLWAGNKKPPISLALQGEVGKHFLKEVTINTPLGEAIYPQGMIVNPLNGYSYIANQLSNNISVLNSDGVVISLITVSDDNPFGDSPVDLTVNSLADSPDYGTVYVANLIGDSVSIINSQLQVIGAIPVGKRPISIAFNPMNELIYVANIAENTISIIDTTTQTVIDTISLETTPKHITINSLTGETYLIQSNNITILSLDNQVSSTIENIGSQLCRAAYHPINQKLYLVSSLENSVIPLNLETFTLETPIATGNDPFAIVFNPNTELLYIGNRGDNSYSIIDTNESVVSTLFLGVVGNSIAFDKERETIFSTNTINGTINFITYNSESDKVLVNEGYFAKREDFTFQPARIEHLKFVLSGKERFTVLNLEEQTVTGTTKTTPISFSSYANPQNFGNVAEVFEMKGSIIDGKNGWRFKIAPFQTITILTYYRQFEKENIINA